MGKIHFTLCKIQTATHRDNFLSNEAIIFFGALSISLLLTLLLFAFIFVVSTPSFCPYCIHLTADLTMEFTDAVTLQALISDHR